MSNPANDEYMQDARQTFEMLVSDKDWEGVNNLFLTFQEDGMSNLEPKLLDLLTDDELAGYRRWHRANSDQTEEE